MSAARPSPEGTHPLLIEAPRYIGETMASRLDRIPDWETQARDADYHAETLAALCSISLRQLERFFQGRFGTTPQNWLLELRCRRARELMERGYSTQAAAADLKFANASHLCHAFKKVYGRPPHTFAPPGCPDVALRQ